MGISSPRNHTPVEQPDNQLNPRRAFVAILVVGVAIALVVAPSAWAGRPTSTTPPPVEQRTVGLAVAGAPTDLSEVLALQTKTGADIDQVTFYAAWAKGGDFPPADASRIAAAGAVPELTWEPWDPSGGTSQPAYALDRITAGDHDAYLARWAKQIKTWGKPLVLRFAHEMNGGWYPWAAGTNGNTADDYVAAWRHVVDVFRRAKVTNVTWSWSVNVPYAGSTPLASLYPGDTYVGRVGLDGYNWGTTQPWSSWQSFGDIFGPGVAELDSLSTRPVHVTETAAPENGGGDKAAWISDMWAWLDAHPEVRGVTWFSLLKEADWRVDSSDASLNAWAAGARTF
ncbi:glycoside hydrolase family 26 protein [Aeromicrobium sp.]|uniref:glycoside hydrolase family 26 protein n=1 Tax=Aeromicrobium sp. TaxID=1871063 RepID=UPI0019B205F3|nr:glycosyl hydrolase [Aeromicrobium sp.]MBC7631783.1 beta-mannanase [Aeromicrobium sp.]